jgi:hypothetical protein
VLAVLTGIGLSASAGLNAYIPLLVIGLLGRYTHLIELPAGWAWLDNGWTLLILTVLLAIEVVADKIPAVDSANDVLHTIIRPTAGGLAFGAASQAQTVTSDPASFFSGHQWIPVVAGGLIALTVHGTKAAARPVVNVSTVGTGAPVVSTIEDIVSTVLSIVAIVLPILVLLFLVVFVLFAIWLRRKLKARRARRAALKAQRRAAGVSRWSRWTPPATPVGTPPGTPPATPPATRVVTPPAPPTTAPTQRLPVRPQDATTRDLRRPER